MNHKKAKTRRNYFYVVCGRLRAAVSACGFHLRGDVALPKVMGKTYIQGATPTAFWKRICRRSLTVAGSQVVDAPQDATAQLRIVSEAFGRRVLTVAITGKARRIRALLHRRF